jgi:2-polyprenyl-6-methoxyphenol hydroxylase-like FAD-dependent oxidoreductase
MRSPGQLGENRLFVVGDAAGYVEPFTGEGMTWALTGAVALAPLVTAACREWHPGFLRHWQTAHRRAIRDRQGLCGWLAWALRRPWLMRQTTRLLKVWPGLASPFIHHLQTPRKECP